MKFRISFVSNSSSSSFIMISKKGLTKKKLQELKENNFIRSESDDQIAFELSSDEETLEQKFLRENDLKKEDVVFCIIDGDDSYDF